MRGEQKEKKGKENKGKVLSSHCRVKIALMLTDNENTTMRISLTAEGEEG